MKKLSLFCSGRSSFLVPVRGEGRYMHFGVLFWGCVLQGLIPRQVKAPVKHSSPLPV